MIARDEVPPHAPGVRRAADRRGRPAVAEDEQRSSRSSAASSTRACGPRCPTSSADGSRQAEMVRAFDEIPRDTGSRHLLPARRRRGALRAATRVTAALLATAIVVLALLWEVAMPWIDRRLDARRARKARRARACAARTTPGASGAPSSAPASSSSCVNDEEWGCTATSGSCACGAASRRPRGRLGARRRDYAYLVYPHKPILAYLPQTGQLLNEYCVEFPDETRPYGSPRLPDSDDVLAKWMALKGDERRLISAANLHLPGRQVDPSRSSATSGGCASGSACASPARHARRPTPSHAAPRPPTGSAPDRASGRRHEARPRRLWAVGRRLAAVGAAVATTGNTRSANASARRRRGHARTRGRDLPTRTRHAERSSRSSAPPAGR